MVKRRLSKGLPSWSQGFFNALVFFTRLPGPPGVDYSSPRQAQAAAWAPLIGWIVGGVAALIVSSAALVWPLGVAVALSMAATVWLTGALHEDGWADVCDALGAGGSRERMVAIMKDPRIGAYGALGLGLLLLLKWSALVALGERSGVLALSLALLAGHSVSRAAAVSFMVTHQYLGSDQDSKAGAVATRLSRAGWLFALGCALAPVALASLLGYGFFSLAVIFVTAARWALSYRVIARLGGYRGDCLGAVQQITEVTFYLVVCAGYPRWNFI